MCLYFATPYFELRHTRTLLDTEQSGETHRDKLTHGCPFIFHSYDGSSQVCSPYFSHVFLIIHIITSILGNTADGVWSPGTAGPDWSGVQSLSFISASLKGLFIAWA